jgi:hypothetical protein
MAPQRWLAMAAAIALLTLSGPFGTLDYPLTTRLVYWAIVVVASYVCGHTGGVIASELFSKTMAVPLRIFLIALGSSVPASLVVVLATYIAEPQAMPNPLVLWFYVFAVCLAYVGLLMTMKPRQDDARAPESLEPRQPALLDRLPRHLRGRLLHLEVSDHYVEVTTDKGKTLVLMRLADAMRETAPTAGLQVHRSHWVALDSVRRGLRQAGKPALELEDGVVVPISRTYLDAVRAAGLLP